MFHKIINYFLTHSSKIIYPFVLILAVPIWTLSFIILSEPYRNDSWIIKELAINVNPTIKSLEYSTLNKLEFCTFFDHEDRLLFPPKGYEKEWVLIKSLKKNGLFYSSSIYHLNEKTIYIPYNSYYYHYIGGKENIYRNYYSDNINIDIYSIGLISIIFILIILWISLNDISYKSYSLIKNIFLITALLVIIIKINYIVNSLGFWIRRGLSYFEVNYWILKDTISSSESLNVILILLCFILLFFASKKIFRKEFYFAYKRIKSSSSIYKNSPGLLEYIKLNKLELDIQNLFEIRVEQISDLKRTDPVYKKIVQYINLKKIGNTEVEDFELKDLEYLKKIKYIQENYKGDFYTALLYISNNWANGRVKKQVVNRLSRLNILKYIELTDYSIELTSLGEEKILTTPITLVSSIPVRYKILLEYSKKMLAESDFQRTIYYLNNFILEPFNKDLVRTLYNSDEKLQVALSKTGGIKNNDLKNATLEKLWSLIDNKIKSEEDKVSHSERENLKSLMMLCKDMRNKFSHDSGRSENENYSEVYTYIDLARMYMNSVCKNFNITRISASGI